MAMTERTPEHPNTGRANTGEPRLAAIGSWAVLFASFGLSAATWIALALIAGFTEHATLTGPLGTLTVRLAWLMPVAIDGYVVVALVLWTAPVPEQVAAFARKNTYAAASIGVAAQSAFHALTVLSATHSPWRSVMAAVVGALPPAVAALAVHMRALIRRKSGRSNSQPITVRRMTPIAPRTIAEPSARTISTNAPIAPITRTASTGTDTPDTTVRVNGEQPDTEAANVRPITSARRAARTNSGQPSESRTEKLQRIKDVFGDWRTNMPSVRDCARVLGVAPSTAHTYQQDLVREARDAPPAADLPEPDPLGHERPRTLATATA